MQHFEDATFNKQSLTSPYRLFKNEIDAYGWIYFLLPNQEGAVNLFRLIH